MKSKVTVLISILILMFVHQAKSQQNPESIHIINSTNGYSYTSNVDSITRIYKKPLIPDWETLLTISFLKTNQKGYADSTGYNSPFEPYPVETILNEADFQYMKESVRKSIIKNWEKNLISNPKIKILNKKVRLSPFKNSLNIGDYLEVSYPVFTEDGKNAIIQIDHLCGGECGSGYLFILKKVDGKWIKLCQVLIWMS